MMGSEQLTDLQTRAALDKVEQLRDALLASVEPWTAQVAAYIDTLDERLARDLANHLDREGADDVSKGIPNWSIRKALRDRWGV